MKNPNKGLVAREMSAAKNIISLLQRADLPAKSRARVMEMVADEIKELADKEVAAKLVAYADEVKREEVRSEKAEDF